MNINRWTLIEPWTSRPNKNTHKSSQDLLDKEWSLPEYGIFELDYVSCYRPPAKAQALSDDLWESLMVTMYNCKEWRLATSGEVDILKELVCKRNMNRSKRSKYQMFLWFLEGTRKIQDSIQGGLA